MPVSPTGKLARLLDGVRTELSESAAFQALVGAADAAEALGSIYVRTATGVTGSFALIMAPNGMTQVAPKDGDDAYQIGGTVEVRIVGELSASGATDEDEYFTALNAVGAILDELSEGCASAASGTAARDVDWGAWSMGDVRLEGRENKRQTGAGAKSKPWACVLTGEWSR